MGLALSMRRCCFQDASNFYAHFCSCASSRRQRVSAGLQSLESKFLASAVFVTAILLQANTGGLAICNDDSEPTSLDSATLDGPHRVWPIWPGLARRPTIIPRQWECLMGELP